MKVTSPAREQSRLGEGKREINGNAHRAGTPAHAHAVAPGAGRLPATLGRAASGSGGADAPGAVSDLISLPGNSAPPPPGG